MELVSLEKKRKQLQHSVKFKLVIKLLVCEKRLRMLGLMFSFIQIILIQHNSASPYSYKILFDLLSRQQMIIENNKSVLLSPWHYKWVIICNFLRTFQIFTH